MHATAKEKSTKQFVFCSISSKFDETMLNVLLLLTVKISDKKLEKGVFQCFRGLGL